MFAVTGFFRAVGVLAAGAGVAATITALILPVLTRLYTPADFGILAVFAGLTSMLAVAACLRFDAAIPIPDQESEAANLLALALICTLAVAALAATVIVCLPARILAGFNQSGLAHYLWLLPLAVICLGWSSALQFWSVRKKDFGSLASMRIAQAGAGAGVQVTIGSLGGTALGLILGPIVNAATGCAGLAVRVAAADLKILKAISWLGLRSAFSNYRRFPQYSAIEALSNNAGIQLPIILIAALTAGREAGFLLLALSIIQAPMVLLGDAVAQVYLSRAPEELRARRLDVFTAEIFGRLLKVGIGPLIFAGILAPTLFGIIFGRDWHRAGVLMAWMTPWFMMQFLAVPISMGLHVTSHQRSAFVLQVFGLTLRLGSVLAASAILGGFVSELYCLSGFAFYLVYLAAVLYIVDVKASDVSFQIMRGLPIVLLWMGAGILLYLLRPLLV